MHEINHHYVGFISFSAHFGVAANNQDLLQKLRQNNKSNQMYSTLKTNVVLNINRTKNKPKLSKALSYSVLDYLKQ